MKIKNHFHKNTNATGHFGSVKEKPYPFHSSVMQMQHSNLHKAGSIQRREMPLHYLKQSDDVFLGIMKIGIQKKPIALRIQHQQRARVYCAVCINTIYVNWNAKEPYCFKSTTTAKG